MRAYRMAVKEWPVLLLVGIYAFLFAPIVTVALVAFSSDPFQPFDSSLSTDWFARMLSNSDYSAGLRNSLVIGWGSAGLALIVGLPAALAVRSGTRKMVRLLVLLLMLPLVLNTVLIGMSTRLLFAFGLQIESGLASAMLANSTRCISFAFLIMGIQVLQHNWGYERAARAAGASAYQAWVRVTLPLIFPGILAAALVGFLVAFNDLEITALHVGATFTIPTLTHGMLRHGIKPELYAFATLVITITLGVVAILGLFLWSGILKEKERWN